MIDIRAQYEIGNERLLGGLIGVLLFAGFVLLALNGPFSAVRDLRILNFVLFTLPVAIAIVCYVRVGPTASLLEVGALVLWAYYTIRTTGVVGYFVFGGRSAPYAGEMAELQSNVTLFCLLVAVCAGTYALAASQDERPLLKWALVAVLPLGQLAAYGVYSLT